jgi:hypothetical protein
MTVKQGEPVSYKLHFGDEEYDATKLLGKKLLFRSNGEIRCLHCQKRTNKSFNQGYCYPCFTKLAQCDRCIMSPELCHYSQGTCREPEWGETHCMQEHIVYLANSTGLKVGITRHTQVPTRWIDQGAIAALPIFSVKSRYLSGLVEVLMKQWVADKTNWRKMLKHDVVELDLEAERDRLFELASEQLEELNTKYPGEITALSDQEIWAFEYPHLSWPEKIKTFNFDKQDEVEGTLMAIKGQYLILDTGCLNIRKFTSYDVSLEVE